LPRTVSVLQCDPDLAEDLSDEELASARAQVVGELVDYPTGPWAVGPDDFDRSASFGLLLIEGLLAREVTVADYTCAELLGPGDVLQPWLRAGPEQSVATEVDWDVVQTVRAAFLGRRFSESASNWPEIPAAVSRRLMQRTHWLAFHLAVCGLRRVEERLLLVLWHFADRWGTVTPEGVRLDLRLTHDLLAAVTGARRPSVTNGLQRLAAEGQIQSRPRSRWLLLGEPPAELEHIHHRSRRPRNGNRPGRSTSKSTPP
jgi:CRP/FNR family transcriptional regulator, cyclic AMP receptor protein